MDLFPVVPSQEHFLLPYGSCLLGQRRYHAKPLARSLRQSGNRLFDTLELMCYNPEQRARRAHDDHPRP